MNNNEQEDSLVKIRSAIEEVRPYLRADGGDVELVSLNSDNTVLVRLTGACDGCPCSMMTLRAGIEQAIRNKFPELKEVLEVD